VRAETGRLSGGLPELVSAARTALR